MTSEAQSKAIDFSVRLQSHADLETFSNCIKEAVCSAFSKREHFGAIRLAATRLEYTEFSSGLRGQTDGQTVQVSQTESALQLAGTVVHELAHALVGTVQLHNAHWEAAAKALGLKHVELHQSYVPEHFEDYLLEAIRKAIERLYKEHPQLVYPSDIPIPVPAYIGMPDCPEAHLEDCSYGHAKHVLQYQLDGTRWLLGNAKRTLLYCDEPGLGKTWGALLYLNAVQPSSVLIICPNNVKLVWREHFKYLVVQKELLDELEIASAAVYTFSPVTIMSYETARRFKDAIAKMHWDLVIVDEAHYCKTPSAARTKAVFGIQDYSKELMLTGTPIVNYIDEAWPLVHHADPDNWRSFAGFASRYMTSGSRFGRNLTEFNNRLRSTIMLRRLKKDVLKELPQKRRQMVEFEVTEDIAKLIEEEKALWKQATASASGSDYESVKLFNAMKNESDVALDDIDWARVIEELQHTRKYAFERMAIIAHQIGLAKLPHAIEFITNALENKEKVAVFGHHRDVLSAVASHFRPHSVLLMGNSKDDAFMLANKFSTDPDCNVFVGGLQLAAGYSLKGTSTVIFIEQDWVPGIMRQAEDRCHGLGRGEADATSLMIHYLCFENSLDTYKNKKNIRKLKSIERATGRI